MKMNQMISAAVILVIGILIGGVGVYEHYKVGDLENQIAVRKDDNDAAKDIEDETKTQKSDKTVKVIITKYVKQPAKKCKELNDEEIEAMCTTRYMPDDILQSFRQQADRAWGRFN